MRTERCEHCKETFSVVTAGVGPRQELKPITCPYCRQLWGKETTSGQFLTAPLVTAVAHDENS